MTYPREIFLNRYVSMISSWSFLEMLALEITQKMKILTTLQKFNAKEFLEDICRIDKNLKDLSSGKEFVDDIGFYAEGEEENYEEDGEYDYDDYYYGEEGYSDDDDEYYGYASNKSNAK